MCISLRTERSTFMFTSLNNNISSYFHFSGYIKKELVEQHVDYTDAQQLPWSKRWPFDVPYWSCKLFLDKMYLNHARLSHLVGEQLV